ncbi:hypothetical protein [Halomicrococcus gelatinilyticus]|uniref:hypothetical protein n=1 Tax=Halomicrococcus gelatinilyticus TaxID=1702103 RepID=UPI002E111A4D
MTDHTNDADTGDGGGSRLRTLLLLGVSFLAGYLAGRGKRADVEIAADLEAVPPGEAEPMEIEIEGSETGGAASVEVEGSETGESEAADLEEAAESAEESTGAEEGTESEAETEEAAGEEAESDETEDES